MRCDGRSVGGSRRQSTERAERVERRPQLSLDGHLKELEQHT